MTCDGCCFARRGSIFPWLLPVFCVLMRCSVDGALCFDHTCQPCLDGNCFSGIFFFTLRICIYFFAASCYFCAIFLSYSCFVLPPSLACPFLFPACLFSSHLHWPFCPFALPAFCHPHPQHFIAYLLLPFAFLIVPIFLPLRSPCPSLPLILSLSITLSNFSSVLSIYLFFCPSA